jgi:hypothetical protein
VSTEVVVLMPVLVALVLLCVQVAAWHHAATVATSVAARVAVLEARHGAPAGEGVRRGHELLRELDASAGAPVVVERTASSVHARVTVAVPALFPGLPTMVRRDATVARERFVPEGQR